MGITIHYQGKIDDLNAIPQFVDDLIDFAEIAGWKYDIIDIHTQPQLIGIVLNIHPESEGFRLTFDSIGELKSYFYYQDVHGRERTQEVHPLFVKTQFGGIETHITIIKLLKYINKKYISNLKVYDEGQFWDSGDVKLLRRKFAYLKKALEKTKDIFLDSNLSDGVKNGEELLDRIETLVKLAFGKTEQQTRKQLEQTYGKDVIITRVGRNNLVHLDSPSPEVIQERIEKANNGDYDDFDDDCPLCQAMKGQPYEIVFTAPYNPTDCNGEDECEFYQTDEKKTDEEECKN
jgi:hypothetical protein